MAHHKKLLQVKQPKILKAPLLLAVCMKNTALGWVSQGEIQHLALRHAVLASQHTPFVLYSLFTHAAVDTK